MKKKKVCSCGYTARKRVRYISMRGIEDYETRMRVEKKEGLKAFGSKMLIDFIYSNIKNRIVFMANNSENNYDLAEILEYVKDKESKIHEQICESVIKRTKLMVSQYDNMALAKAQRNGEPIEDVKLINMRKINLEATIKHFLEDKYGLIDKAIKDLKKEKEEQQEDIKDSKNSKTVDNFSDR